MRVACLRVPHLPLVARLRAEPDLANGPLAISADTSARAGIVAASPEALRAGVRPGQTAAQARMACAGLVLRAGSAPLEQAAREALRDAALAFSPRVELAPPAAGVYAAEAAVFLDASGIASLFRSESGFATALAARSRALGLVARVAVASGRTVALLAARAPGPEDGVCVIGPGEEAAWLAPLAVDLLDPSDTLAGAFTRFGIRRIGDLARLPRRALATRLGAEGLRLAALARGEGDGLAIEAPDETGLAEGFELEAPLERLEPLLFVLRGLLDRLAARLDARGLAAAALEISLRLEGGGRDARRVALAAPSAEPRTLLRLVGLALETHPPAAAIEEVCVATQGVPVRCDQLDLFRPAGPAPAQLGRTLAELEALCGPGRVGAPVRPDAHRADDFGLAPFTAVRAAARPGAAPGAAGAPALRALRPPQSARVRLERGFPAQLQSALANGAVLGCAGPWRTSGSWWAPERRFSHDHYDVWTQDGCVVRLRHDRILNAWFVDGLYD